MEKQAVNSHWNWIKDGEQTKATFYRWKKQFGGMDVAEVRRLKQLEEENRQLKRLVANLTLDKQMLQDVLSRKL